MRDDQRMHALRSVTGQQAYSGVSSGSSVCEVTGVRNATEGPVNLILAEVAIGSGVGARDAALDVVREEVRVMVVWVLVVRCSRDTTTYGVSRRSAEDARRLSLDGQGFREQITHVWSWKW